MKPSRYCRASALIACLVVAGCASEESPDEAAGAVESHDDATSATVDGDRPHEDLGLDELTHMSDIIVSGTVIDRQETSHVAADPGWISMIYTIAVDEVIHGEEHSTVRVSIATHADDQEIVMEGRMTPLDGDSGIRFLTEIDPEFDIDAYRLTNDQGPALVDDTGQVRTGELEQLGRDIDESGTDIEDLLNTLRTRG